MTATTVNLLSYLMRLVECDVDAWKTISACVGAGGSENAQTTSGHEVANTKEAAKCELQKLLSGDAMMSCSPDGLFAALLGGMEALFKGICDPAALLAIDISAFKRSDTVIALGCISNATDGHSKEARENWKLFKGGRVGYRAIVAALPLFERAKEENDHESASKMVNLLDHFITDICQKTWGIEDAWSDVRLCDITYSVLEEAARASSASLVSIVLAKAKRADVGMVALQAYQVGHPEVFEVLIADERCINAGNHPLVGQLFGWWLGDRASQPASLEKRRSMLESFLRKWPETVAASWIAAGERLRPLEAAIVCRDPGLVRLVLELSRNALRYEEKKQKVGGGEVYTLSTLKLALRHPCAEVLRLLKEASAFHWDKYDLTAQEELATSLSLCLLCSRPLKDSFERKHEKLCSYREDLCQSQDFLLSV
jgi:hypothetical protein